MFSYYQGALLKSVLEALVEKYPGELRYFLLLERLGYFNIDGPVHLFYVSITIGNSPFGRLEENDSTRVDRVVHFAKELGALQSYHTYTLLNFDIHHTELGPAMDVKLISEQVFTEAAIHQIIGPTALNAAAGGWSHLIKLSPDTEAVLAKVREVTSFAVPNDAHDPDHDTCLKEEIKALYEQQMPSELKTLVSEEYLDMLVDQSCHFKSVYQHIPVGTIGKEISKEAFVNCVPFYHELTGKGPKLLGDLEEVLCPNNAQVIRGCFRNYWESKYNPLCQLVDSWFIIWIALLTKRWFLNDPVSIPTKQQLGCSERAVNTKIINNKIFLIHKHYGINCLASSPD